MRVVQWTLILINALILLDSTIFALTGVPDWGTAFWSIFWIASILLGIYLPQMMLSSSNSGRSLLTAATIVVILWFTAWGAKRDIDHLHNIIDNGNKELHQKLPYTTIADEVKFSFHLRLSMFTETMYAPIQFLCGCYVLFASVRKYFKPQDDPLGIR